MESKLSEQLLTKFKLKSEAGWIKAWIKVGITADLIKNAERFTESLHGFDLTKTSLRNFFNEVKGVQIKGNDPTAILLFRAKLVYALGKNESKEGQGAGLSQLLAFILFAHEQVDVKNGVEFDRFVHLIETLLAYHKLADALKPKQDKTHAKNFNKHRHGN